MGCGTDQNGVVLFDIKCGTHLSGSERCGFIQYGMWNRSERYFLFDMGLDLSDVVLLDMGWRQVTD